MTLTGTENQTLKYFYTAHRGRNSSHPRSLCLSWSVRLHMLAFVFGLARGQKVDVTDVLRSAASVVKLGSAIQRYFMCSLEELIEKPRFH